MTTERRAMAQINKRQQEIKERLSLDVKWQAQNQNCRDDKPWSREWRVTGVGEEGGLWEEGPGVPVHRLHPL